MGGGEMGGSLEVGVGTVQLLVTILRALGLRSRLVLSLNPISFRPSRQKKTDSLSAMDTSSPVEAMGEGSEVKPAGVAGPLGEDATLPQPGPHFYRLMEQLRQRASSGPSMEGSTEPHTEVEEGTGESEDTARERCKRRSTDGPGGASRKKRKLSSEDTPHEKDIAPQNKSSGTRMTSGKGNRRKEKQRKEKRTPTTTSETSPYFTSQRETGEDDGGGSGSDSDFVPLKIRAKRLSFGSDDNGGENEDGAGEGERVRKKGETGRKKGKGKAIRGRPQKSLPKRVELVERKTSGDSTSQAGVYGSVQLEVFQSCW